MEGCGGTKERTTGAARASHVGLVADGRVVEPAAVVAADVV